MSSETVSQNEIIRKNMSALTEAQRQEDGSRSVANRIADRITDFSGSMLFVLIHAIWFGVWVLLNIGLLDIPRISEFDPFPFGLLTMIVSLEAIFLSTFVLISQNRMAKLSERRAELDLHINLLAEQKATKALEMLDKITEQLNSVKSFDFKTDPEVEALKVSPEPQEVLQAMKDAIEEEVEEAKEEVKEEVDKAVEEITGEMEIVRDEVKDITGETKAVRKDVRRVDEKVEAVASDVSALKGEIREGVESDEALLVK